MLKSRLGGYVRNRDAVGAAGKWQKAAVIAGIAGFHLAILVWIGFEYGSDGLVAMEEVVTYYDIAPEGETDPSQLSPELAEALNPEAEADTASGAPAAAAPAPAPAAQPAPKR